MQSTLLINLDPGKSLAQYKVYFKKKTFLHQLWYILFLKKLLQLLLKDITLPCINLHPCWTSLHFFMLQPWTKMTRIFGTFDLLNVSNIWRFSISYWDTKVNKTEKWKKKCWLPQGQYLVEPILAALTASGVYRVSSSFAYLDISWGGYLCKAV